MTKVFCIVLVSLFFCKRLAYSQESMFLALIDSFAFDSIKGYPAHQGNSYFFYDWVTGRFSAFSKQDNQEVVALTFDSLYDHHLRYYHYGDIVHRLSDRYMLIRSTGTHFDFFDLNGKFLHSKRIDQTFEGRKRYINEDNIPKNVLVSSDGKSFFLRVANWPTKPKGEKNYVLRQRKNLKTVGIVAQYNLDGEIINLFGQYDTVYWNEERITDYYNYTVSISSKNEVFLSCELADQVSVYVQGNLVRSVGQRGRYINKDLSEINFSTTKQDWFFNKVTSNIETPFYFDCQIVDDRYLVRTYTAASKDTVHFTKNELETRRKWVSGQLKGCLLKTQNDLNQRRIYRDKQCFVQIFDLQSGDKCLYDGPIDIRFPLCLGMRNGNEFIFTSYLRPEKEQPQKQVLYYYQLKPYKDAR